MKLKLYFLFIFSLLAFVNIQAQWQQVFQVDDNNFYNIYTTTTSDLYLTAEGAQLYHSSDGGQNFSATDLYEYGFIQGVDFVNPMVGYAGGGCYFVFDACPANTLFKTIDGGQTWTTLQADSMGAGVFIDIEAIDEQNVYALSDYGQLLRTQDGGQTWTTLHVDTPSTPYRIYTGMQFFDALTGIVGLRIHTPLEDNQLLYKTTDGGNTWTIIYETNLLNLVDFHFIHPERGFIVSVAGQIHSTDDGGQIWTTNSFGNEHEEAKDLFFVDALHGYISTYDTEESISRIYRSEDGGQSWNVDFELDSLCFGPLHFSDADNGYLIANYRHVYRRSGPNNILEPQDFLHLNVFPNPTADYFSLHNNLNPSESYQLFIYDSIGRLIKKQAIKHGDNQINIASCTTGLYLLEIRDKAHTLRGNGKILKK